MDGTARPPATTSPGTTSFVAGDAERVRQRDSLFLRAMLHLSDEADARDVRIRNLSERGVMVEAGRDVPVGTEAQIEVRGIGKVGGRVVWSIDDRIGIALDRAIDPRRARKPVGATPGKAPPLRR